MADAPTADDPAAGDRTAARDSAELLKGAPLAKAIRAQVAAAVGEHSLTPCLVNVVVGDSEASASYLDAIDRTAAKLGIETRRAELPTESGTAHVVDTVTRLGEDESVHGLMVQFPLPKDVDGRRVAAALPADKDVDGLTEASLGAVLAGRRRHTAPCTAAAVAELLAADPRTDPAGKDVVIVGRSLVVGRPLAAMLAAPGPGGHATVTVCHTRTADLAAHTRRADLVVVAAGVAGILRPEMLRPGAIVVDVGTHPVQKPDGAWGLIGDADPAVAGVASLLTPVPGGVGPVTNAILMRHVTAAAGPGYLPAAW
ncbi:MAG: bifunctional 5,10-methylenetetrahydrofolate dehydrogenase/5,10-methenyltetrahydrofolate cyclohydrolase [Planctomycetota bacterium]|jgi:methylenetetrahydrofolate dehydrogenase (NADP+)/methenyltetrahydrofolate cyclohydrolase